MADAVLLIPGFFGFGRFGHEPGVVLDYFAGVAPIIEKHFDGPVYAHEPPPTGSLDSRVASLHDAVGKLLAGEPLPHYPQVQRADRVHLIGHSTGGVDARLYTHSKYRWVGGPTPDARAGTVCKIGDVVTLSAPFHGTPIAKYAAPDRDVFLMAVYWLTVLGSSRRLGRITGEVIALIVRQLLGGNGRGDQLRTLATALKLMPRDANDDFVGELLAFFKSIVEDRALLNDLTVESMTARNAALAKLGGEDHPRIRCYVSIAPKPASFASAANIADLFGDLNDLAEAALYSHLYSDTAGGDVEGALPDTAEGGLRLGAKLDQHISVARASDGVVPIRSQTLVAGKAAGIILGDHLDVTGHFEGALQRNVFKSSANFEQTRLEQLWEHIAKGLGKP